MTDKWAKYLECQIEVLRSIFGPSLTSIAFGLSLWRVIKEKWRFLTNLDLEQINTTISHIKPRKINES